MNRGCPRTMGYNPTRGSLPLWGEGPITGPKKICRLWTMKNIILGRNRRMFLVMGALVSAFLLGGIGQVAAYDGHQDRNGFRDGNGYHRYGYNHHHRGYWNQQNGVRLWINI